MKRHFSSAPVAASLALAIAAAASTSPARGDTPATQPANARLASAAPAAARPAWAGLVVGIDRETGMLVMPPPERLARILAARRARAGSARPAPVHHPDGTISLDVRSWMRDYAVVHAGPNGRATFGCVDGADAARRATHETPAAPAALEDR